MLSEIKSGNAVRFRYSNEINTNGDSYQAFLSPSVYKQSEQKLLFSLLVKKISLIRVGSPPEQTIKSNVSDAEIMAQPLLREWVTQSPRS